jgi:hypothetical protein
MITILARENDHALSSNPIDRTIAEANSPTHLQIELGEEVFDVSHVVSSPGIEDTSTVITLLCRTEIGEHSLLVDVNRPTHGSRC